MVNYYAVCLYSVFIYESAQAEFMTESHHVTIIIMMVFSHVYLIKSCKFTTTELNVIVRVLHKPFSDAGLFAPMIHIDVCF